MKIGFIGVGKLGLPCAEVMAKGGKFGSKHTVRGYDIAGFESDVVMNVKTVQGAVEEADIVFVAVPTPHDPAYDGRNRTAHLPTKDFDYSIAAEVLAEVDKYSTPEQCIVLISTCLPGTVRRELAPLITKSKLIYNPYFIAMGTVAEDFMNPEFFIIGTEDGDPNNIQPLLDFYSSLFDAKKHVTTWDEAEAVKIFYNTFISFKISFVNMIQDVAMKMGHINVDKVTDALCDATDRLISPAYMKAGMGDGGGCHPRDNIALRGLAERLNLGYDLYGAVMESREIQAANLAEFLVKYDMPIVILGKAYKPHVPYEDGSYSILVGSIAEEMGAQVKYVDKVLGGNEFGTPSVYLIGHLDNDLYCHPFPSGSVVVDPWRKCRDIGGVEVVHYGNTRPK